MALYRDDKLYVDEDIEEFIKPDKSNPSIST